MRDLYPQNPEIAELHAVKDRELWERPGAQSYHDPDRHARRPAARHDLLQGDVSPGEPAGLVGAIFDVTARTRAETALRESEERFRAVVDSANEGMLVYDRSLNIIAGNRAAERIVGLPLGELIGKPGFTSLLPCIARGRHAARPRTSGRRASRCAAGKPQTDLRIGIQRADGAVTWLSVNTAFLRRVDETDYYGLVSTITDITAQHDAEARLRESEARFRRTFELAGSGMAHIGMDRRFIRVNRRLCEILGYPRGGAAAAHRRGRSRIPTTSTSSTSSARRCTRARSTPCAWRSATCARTARWSG